MSIHDNLLTINNQIQLFASKYQRDPHTIALLAVSKGQSIEKIREAYDAGQQLFGENYLQEALIKMTALSDVHIEWHFIGPIQSNKTRKIAEHFSWVHSVDNLKTAQRLNDQRPAHLPPLNICLEVNISHEISKSGIAPPQTKSLATTCLSLPRLRLRGLMAIPAPQIDFQQQRAAFHLLAELFHALRGDGIPLDTLSMGMSDDFEAAIAEGSTIIRLGTAVFGRRENRG